MIFITGGISSKKCMWILKAKKKFLSDCHLPTWNNDSDTFIQTYRLCNPDLLKQCYDFFSFSTFCLQFLISKLDFIIIIIVYFFSGIFSCPKKGTLIEFSLSIEIPSVHPLSGLLYPHEGHRHGGWSLSQLSFVQQAGYTLNW